MANTLKCPHGPKRVLNKAGGCKLCQKERMHENYLRNRDERIAKAQLRQLLNGWKDGALKRARERGFQIVEEVDPFVVYERDKGICQLCNRVVDLSLDRMKDNEAASLDHIAPVHSYATVQLAHRRCNSEKQ